jgi:GNAT superfamily N-acetyltransferase
MEIELRIISFEDAAAISRLSGQLGYRLSVAETEDRIREIAASADHIAFAAMDGVTMVGWIHAGRAVLLESNPFIEIGGLVVEETCRGQGVGKMLVQKVKKWCLEKSIPDLRVRSNVKREAAHKFYEALGFTEEKKQNVFQITL